MKTFITKLLICIAIISAALYFDKPEAKTVSVSSSLTYANKQLDVFTKSVSKKCNGSITCSSNMFNKEYTRLDKSIRNAYGKDDVGYTYHVMSIESLCNSYMKNNKELSKSFKEKICLVKYGYGQLKYMGIV